MLGTPDYIAPEQTLDAAQADIRADIYSLGCTLYFLLTGARRSRARSLFELLQAHQSMEARPLNQVRPDVPAELAAVVREDDGEGTGAALPEAGRGGAGVGPVRQANGNRIASQARPCYPFLRRSLPRKPRCCRLQSPPRSPWRASPRHRLSCGKRGPRGLAPLAGKATTGKKWLLGGATATVGLLVLVALLGAAGLWAAGVFKVKTKDGTIVLENLPPDADVTVDGNVVLVKSADGNTFQVRVDAEKKKHRIEVKKDGFKVFGEEVELEAGGHKSILVALGAGNPTRPTTEAG